MPAGEQEGSKDTLTVSPWRTQESGARGLHVDARPAVATKGNPFPQLPKRQGRGSAMGRGRVKGKTKEAGRKRWEHNLR